MLLGGDRRFGLSPCNTKRCSHDHSRTHACHIHMHVTQSSMGPGRQAPADVGRDTQTCEGVQAPRRCGPDVNSSPSARSGRSRRLLTSTAMELRSDPWQHAPACELQTQTVASTDAVLHVGHLSHLSHINPVPIQGRCCWSVTPGSIAAACLCCTTGGVDGVDCATMHETCPPAVLSHGLAGVLPANQRGSFHLSQ